MGGKWREWRDERRWEGREAAREAEAAGEGEDKLTATLGNEVSKPRPGIGSATTPR